jgi:tryptophan synthase alpha chain
LTGEARLRAAFVSARSQERTAVLPYFVAGWPTFRHCRELLWQAQESGADAAELGIPFTDPVADGPTIQTALEEARQRGATPRRCLDFVRGLRQEGLVLPLVGMTYANLLRAARAWNHAGLDGAIVPDVSWEDSQPWRQAFHAAGLGTVAFASPATRSTRLRRILRSSNAFVYLVSVYGTTGARRSMAPETRRLLAAARRQRGGGGPPLCVGFGVSGPDHVAALRRLGADGVIVGSAIVERVRHGDNIGRFLRVLRAAAQV